MDGLHLFRVLTGEEKKNRFHTDFPNSTPLGKGAFGQVYLANNKSNRPGEQCAIKKIKVGEGMLEEEALEEARILSEMRHRNIIQYIDHWKEFSDDVRDIYFYIRMEYYEGTTLETAITNGSIDPKYMWLIGRQILQGLDYIHERGIAHYDLKADNILIDNQYRIKLIDFGLAQRLEKSNSKEQQSTVYSDAHADFMKQDLKDAAKIISRLRSGPSLDDFQMTSLLQPTINCGRYVLPAEDPMLKLLLNKEFSKLPTPVTTTLPPEDILAESGNIFKASEPDHHTSKKSSEKFENFFSHFKSTFRTISLILVTVVFMVILIVWGPPAVSCLLLSASVYSMIQRTKDYEAAYLKIMKVKSRIIT